jgi:hypothetical protein
MQSWCLSPYRMFHKRAWHRSHETLSHNYEYLHKTTEAIHITRAVGVTFSRKYVYMRAERYVETNGQKDRRRINTHRSYFLLQSNVHLERGSLKYIVAPTTGMANIPHKRTIRIHIHPSIIQTYISDLLTNRPTCVYVCFALNNFWTQTGLLFTQWTVHAIRSQSDVALCTSRYT